MVVPLPSRLADVRRLQSRRVPLRPPRPPGWWWAGPRPVPGDLVTASASSLDLDITLTNAEFQLDRVAAKWADDKKRDAADVRKEIEADLQEKAHAPWGGVIGESLVNVLDVNLELHKRFGDPA